jgi:Zn-dependent alcohol dehydrogenase
MVYSTEALVVPAVGTDPGFAPVILDSVRDDELLVEIHATGICHTDIACIEGKLPAEFPCVLGHEGTYIPSLP